MRWSASGICFAVVLLLSPCRAQSPAAAPDLEELVNGIVEKKMAECRAPGAAVVVVKDGARVFSKAYGYANLEKRVPVDIDRTRFCLASITKTFTATAVMQLVEKGTIDLDADVNRYLGDPHLPDTYPEPVTLAQLLTHTSGIEHSLLGMGTFSDSDRLSLDQHLSSHRSARVMPPGRLFTYSNRNYTWVGRLVEVVAHMPFERYLEAYVLRPLSMNCTGFELPPHPDTELAIGYRLENEKASAWPFPHLNDFPAGGLLSTGTDMALFMLAHLQQGSLGEARILEQRSIRRMHERRHTFHPALAGMTLGFMEERQAGRRALTHEGFMAGFTSFLFLVPDARLGVFTVTNGGSEECSLVHDLPWAILDHYVPPASANTPPIAKPNLPDRARRLVGTYRSVEYARTTFEKASVLLGAVREARVNAAPDGSLMIRGHRYVEVEPLVFDREDRKARIAFQEGIDGQAALMARDNHVYERVAWYAEASLHRWLFLFTTLPLLGTLIVWPVGAVRSWFRRDMPRPTPLDLATRWSARFVALPPLIFVATIVAACLGPLGPAQLIVAIPWWVKAASLLPWSLLPASVALLVATVIQHRAETRLRLAMPLRVGVALTGFGLFCILAYWNLLGIGF